MLYIFWIQVLCETCISQLFSVSLCREKKAITFRQIRILSFGVPGNAQQPPVSVDVCRVAASLCGEDKKHMAPEFALKEAALHFQPHLLLFLHFTDFNYFFPMLLAFCSSCNIRQKCTWKIHPFLSCCKWTPQRPHFMVSPKQHEMRQSCSTRLFR